VVPEEFKSGVIDLWAINFKTNTIDFHMKPPPKSAHFFSLATPISVSGPFSDYTIGVTAAGALGTMFNLATSVVTVPYKWIFTDNMETSGEKACSAAMDWVKSSGKE